MGLTSGTVSAEYTSTAYACSGFHFFSFFFIVRQGTASADEDEKQRMSQAKVTWLVLLKVVLDGRTWLGQAQAKA
jgi:hypothetical protein